MSEVACVLCGRTGTHGFRVSSGTGYAGTTTWRCANGKACKRRQDAGDVAMFAETCACGAAIDEACSPDCADIYAQGGGS